MVEGGGCSAVFPVLFFDGDSETDIGDVEITPFFEYKPFQQLLSKKIGISPNQISIYLVNRHRNYKPPSPEERVKVPITGKANFSVVCRQKGCSFYVVLKRSRKSRNRRERISDSSRENPVLLRRDQTAPFYERIPQSALDDLNGRLQLHYLNGRLQRLKIQKQERVDSSNFGSNLYFDSFPTIENIYGANSGGLNLTTTKDEEDVKNFCKECWNAKNSGAATTSSFHHCVNDAVITCFNTRLGPINRPIKYLP